MRKSEKCSGVQFSTRTSARRSPISFNYEVNGKQISSKLHQKDFNWRPHYQLITSRAYKMLGLLRRVFSSSVAMPAKWSLYTSLVRSQLLYCFEIWHPYLLVDVKAIELVQRRATKFISSTTRLGIDLFTSNFSPDDGALNCGYDVSY